MSSDYAWVIMKPAQNPATYFSHGYYLYFFLFFANLWWFRCWRFLGWGLRLGFCGWSFQLMGFRDCGMGRSGFFWDFGSIYKHRRMTLGKKLCDNESCEREMPEVQTHLLYID